MNIVTVRLHCPDCGFRERVNWPESTLEDSYSVPCRECGKMIEPKVEERTHD